MGNPVKYTIHSQSLGPQIAVFDPEDFDRLPKSHYRDRAGKPQLTMSTTGGRPSLFIRQAVGAARYKTVSVARWIMGIADQPLSLRVKHINGDPLDFRRSNLTVVAASKYNVLVGAGNRRDRRKRVVYN